MIGLTSFNMQIPTGFERVLIIVVIVVIFFVVKKNPEIARYFGRAKTEYEKSKIEARRELDSIKNDMSYNPAADREVGID